MQRLTFWLFFASHFFCEKTKWCWEQYNHLHNQEGKTLCVSSSQHPCKNNPVSGVQGIKAWWDPYHTHRWLEILWEDKMENRGEINGIVSNSNNNRTSFFFSLSFQCVLFWVHSHTVRKLGHMDIWNDSPEDSFAYSWNSEMFGLSFC